MPTIFPVLVGSGDGDGCSCGGFLSFQANITAAGDSFATGNDCDNNAASTRTVNPARPTPNVGKVGKWEYVHGNWVLRPSSADDVPRAVLHFLGGALVGASPHITYRYMLEKLAEKGFLVIATPYQLSFDHLQTCDDVITKFEQMAPSIARQYGALPVVGIGHSCGALLQLLITSLFPDTPRAGNALLSFNNKPVTDAVPFFEEVFAPFFTTIATQNITPTATSNELLKIYLQMAKAATEGELPPDEVLQQLQKALSPFETESGVKVPQELRETINQIFQPSVSALSDAGVLAIMNQAVHSLEQIPKLVDEVAVGARDFVPTPAATRTAARKAYRARRTLIVEFSDDSIDESNELEQLLKEAESITRMRRPMVDVAVQRKILEGGHATPLWAPPLDLAERAEDILGPDTSKERLAYQQADATVEELVRWLEEGNL
eukprot:CAMPEP_0176024204 /NCGR_PEP_ID=MMETSP0120_2-20121206/11824_1 /TAXON_ID=160619 /ORGANISM="Kryptoperidinium foliaceum, Strain CCMP 1326" /LENGTH=434 /DNA_ID=CAMNT_0017357381 /DNA_START=93 /DNA_END=1398 /DNA_ORIENTATION=+